MDLQLQLVFQERLSLLGPRDCEEAASHIIPVNQRNTVNPVADKAALSRFYRSITETLEPTGTIVWPLGVLVL